MVVMTLAFMGATLTYVIVGLQMRASGALPLADMDGSVLWILRGALAFVGLAGQAAVELVASSPRLKPGPWTPGASEPQLARASTVTVLRLALTEAIGIFGLLLFMLGNHLADLLAFNAVALVMLGVRFPTKERWAREVGAG